MESMTQISPLEVPIRDGLLDLMRSSVGLGHRLILAQAHGDFCELCGRTNTSEAHAQLLINITVRHGARRSQGDAEIQAIASLVDDGKLLNQLLSNTAQMIEGMR